MANNARDELLRLIDQGHFNPVIDADPNDYSGGDRPKLEALQRMCRSTKKSYHDKESAEEVLGAFRDDLTSEAAEDVEKQLQDLGLPTLPDIEEEVDRKARELGVK